MRVVLEAASTKSQCRGRSATRVLPTLCHRPIYSKYRYPLRGYAGIGGVGEIAATRREVVMSGCREERMAVTGPRNVTSPLWFRLCFFLRRSSDDIALSPTAPLVFTHSITHAILHDLQHLHNGYSSLCPFNRDRASDLASLDAPQPSSDPEWEIHSFADSGRAVQATYGA